MQPITNQIAKDGMIIALILAASAPATAADPMYGSRTFTTPKPEMSVDHWTGAYAGVSLGSLTGVAEVDRGPGNNDFEVDERSFMLGGFIGYNFRPFSGGWLIGTEVDVSIGDFHVETTDPVLGNAETNGNFISSLQVRAGYAWERVFVYGTAGLALTDIDLSPQGNNDTDIRAGIAIGLGAELAINDKWSTRIDATGYGFGEDGEAFSGTNRNVRIGAGTLRAGISRRF